jgi:hypothetical protein
MAKFVKKPIPIEATQWNKDGDHSNVKRVYIPQDLDPPACEKCGQPAIIHGTIITLEGKGGAQEVCPGDWIITGVQGENYPIKNDIFLATYDQVAEDEEEDFEVEEIIYKGVDVFWLMDNSMDEINELLEKKWRDE